MRIFDIRWRLDDPGAGRRTYLEGHIPGAVFVDLDTDLSAVGSPPNHGRHPLPTPEQFARTLGNLGLGRDDAVVVYDDGPGTVAARMWWMLRSIGHREVRVLDGGYERWKSLGLPVALAGEQPIPRDYPEPAGFHGVVGPDDLDHGTLIDVRAAERYVGEFEPIDPVAGHIPGAVNMPASLNFEEDRLKDSSELISLYGSISNPIVSCGSGVTACHTALAMVHAGLEMPEVYVGSYSQWSNLDRPVSTGENQ